MINWFESIICAILSITCISAIVIYYFFSVYSSKDMHNKTIKIAYKRKQRYKFGIAGLLAASLTLIFTYVNYIIGTSSNLITICELDSLESNISGLCNLIMPFYQSRVDSDEKNRSAFLGKWVGAWDRKWIVEFNVKDITAEQDSFSVSVEYIHQENTLDKELQISQLNCSFIGSKKIYCPSNLDIEFTESKKFTAHFYNDNTIRTAELLRVDKF